MNYTFSPSSLSLLKECPKCFWLHFNKNIRRPNGIFPSLPSGMDRILKVHFDSYRDKNELPPELKKLKGVRLFNNIELLKTWRNNIKGIQYKDKNGNLIRGAVDNLLEKGSKLIVLDYKTRGFPLKEDTAEHYPDKVNREGEILFNTDLVKMSISISNAEKIIKNALKILEIDIPDSSEECEFCKWREISL